MEEAAEQLTVPAICRNIRETRLALRRSWQAEHPGEPNRYTIEAVAGRIKLTSKTYGDIERGKRQSLPGVRRLKEIAVALDLEEDHFLKEEDWSAMSARLEAEADRHGQLNDRLEELLEELRDQLGGEESAQSHDEL